VEVLMRKGDLNKARHHLDLAKSTWPGHPRLADLTDELERARFDQP